MQCSGEHVILRGIFHVVSGFPVYISCYIAEIWIAYLTVYSIGGAIQYTVEGENEGKNDNTVCTVITVVAISLERDKSLERLTLHAYFLHLKLKILFFYFKFAKYSMFTDRIIKIKIFF